MTPRRGPRGRAPRGRAPRLHRAPWLRPPLGSDSVPDITVFIAAVNEAAIGTSYEDAALRDPEVFIGVGQLFCELLDDGLTVDSVLTEYLTALQDGAAGTVADDDALITGVLMGVSLEILCPRHKDKRG